MRVLKSFFLTAAAMILIFSISSAVAGNLPLSPTDNHDYMIPQTSIESGKGTYDARVVIYMMEKVSTLWKYKDEDIYYKNAFMAFALDSVVNLAQDEVLNQTIIFDTTGTAFGYTTMTEENVMAVIGVFGLKDPQEQYSYPPNQGFYYANYLDASAGADPYIIIPNTVNEDFTHTVLADEATATW
ncbi:MAG: hypothetical protein ABIJ12_07700 [bacterium]